MILPPTNCPCCNSLLEKSNDQLYCRNDQCSSSREKRIEHFAKTLKIKGLGPATINKLKLKNIVDIYDLKVEEASTLLSSKKLAEKLIEEIEKSTFKSLNDILPAFGIPLIGKSASEKLSLTCKSISDITEETCKEAGLGEKATNNILKWLEEDTDYPFLPFSYEFDSLSTPKEAKGIICISGKLNSFKNKSEAKQILEELGFIVKDLLTKDVTYLVNESNRETSKTKKARESGVTIITQLDKFIGEFKI